MAPLYCVVTGVELRTAVEAHNHEVRVQRSEKSESGPQQVEVNLRPYQLRGPHTPIALPTTPLTIIAMLN